MQESIRGKGKAMSVSVAEAEDWVGQSYQAVVAIGSHEYQAWGDDPDEARLNAMELALQSIAAGEAA